MFHFMHEAVLSFFFTFFVVLLLFIYLIINILEDLSNIITFLL